MNNKLKLELMEDGLVDIAKSIIEDFYPDYFMGREIDKESDTQMIELFDTLHTISNKRDFNIYETLAYDMGYYFGVTTKKGISDSDKKSIIDYIEELQYKAEDNEWTLKDYIENYEGDTDDMTPEEQYDYDKNQREFNHNRIINLINKI